MGRGGGGGYFTNEMLQMCHFVRTKDSNYTFSYA